MADEKVDGGLPQRVREGLAEMWGRIESIDGLLEGDFNGNTKSKIRASLERHRYHVVGYRPLFVLGESYGHEGITVTPIAIGSNGYPRKQNVRLEQKYNPEESGHQKPTQGKIDGFAIEVRDEFRRYFLEQFGLHISSGEGGYTLSRDVEFGFETLSREIKRFWQDIRSAKLYLDEEGKKSTSQYVDAIFFKNSTNQPPG